MKKKLLSVKISLIAISVVCQAVGNDVSAVKYSLPQFGHYTHHGVIQDDLPRGVDERDAVLYLRPVEKLIEEWFSSCLDKAEVQPVTSEAVEEWKSANYVPVEKKLQHVEEARQIDHVASVVAYLAVEYKVYGLDVKKFKTCMGYINRLSKDSRALRIFDGKLTIDMYREKARKNYKTVMMKIDSEIRRLMLPLEVIHKKEFAKWAYANPQQYAELKKNDDTLEHNLLMQAKIDECTEAARRAEMAARDAESAARNAAAVPFFWQR